MDYKPTTEIKVQRSACELDDDLKGFMVRQRRLRSGTILREYIIPDGALPPPSNDIEVEVLLPPRPIV